MVLFDTDVCLSLLAGNRKIVEKFGSVLDEICVPSVCVPELFLVVELSEYPEENRCEVEKFLATIRVIYPDSDTLRFAARLQKKLQKQNLVVPQNDVHIFSMSKILGARIVTLHADRYRFT